jgi:hypothetical protein
MRVIAGMYGGRTLRAPPGAATRPTSDRVREALFSILGGNVQGARVLDLFAGSGALGIEALSRGAEHATLVDDAAAAIKAVRANLGDEPRVSLPDQHPSKGTPDVHQASPQEFTLVAIVKTSNVPSTTNGVNFAQLPGAGTMINVPGGPSDASALRESSPDFVHARDRGHVRRPHPPGAARRRHPAHVGPGA